MLEELRVHRDNVLEDGTLLVVSDLLYAPRDIAVVNYHKRHLQVQYATEEERREAIRQSQRKYYNTHRRAINAGRAKRARKRRAAIKAGQKETY